MTGDHSAGFVTTVHPGRQRRRDLYQVESMKGVFHGVMTPTGRSACASRRSSGRRTAGSTAVAPRRSGRRRSGSFPPRAGRLDMKRQVPGVPAFERGDLVGQASIRLATLCRSFCLLSAG